MIRIQVSMKLFTVEEANALLPELRARLEALRRMRRLITRLADELKLAEARATEGGGTIFGGRYLEALHQATVAANAISEMGVQIKDLERGLFDFPHLREGRVVLLCWLQNEDQIEWWHEVEAGFAGRQPL